MANVWKLNKNGQSHKTIEWVKLIDYEYSQKEGQSMIKIQFCLAFECLLCALDFVQLAGDRKNNTWTEDQALSPSRK